MQVVICNMRHDNCCCVLIDQLLTVLPNVYANSAGDNFQPSNASSYSIELKIGDSCKCAVEFLLELHSNI